MKPQVTTAVMHVHRGITFFVGPRTPFPGIGWSVPLYDHLGGLIRSRESHGAFYDGDEKHPEGALVWAEASCRAFIDNMLNKEEKK